MLKKRLTFFLRNGFEKVDLNTYASNVETQYFEHIMQKFMEKSTIRTNTLEFDHFVELKLNPSDFGHIIHDLFQEQVFDI